MQTMNDIRRASGVARLFPAALVAVVIAFGLYFDHAASFEDPTAVAMKETSMKERIPGRGDAAIRS